MRRAMVCVLTVLACVSSGSAGALQQGPGTPAAPAAPATSGGPTSGPDMNAFYQLGPDASERAGVPKGTIRGPFVLPSEAYPGTQHTYWLHVPAQYDPAVPASLMVFQDGHAYMDPNGQVRAPIVIDNLIYRREIPVMITVFINPGRRPEQPEPNAQQWGDPTTNRPTEYNTLDDRYARVVVDELIPALVKDYNISRDPERRGIGGTSSGAIAAFTVAWQRPNEFRKVLSIIGSFVNLRGGDGYADLIMKRRRSRSACSCRMAGTTIAGLVAAATTIHGAIGSIRTFGLRRRWRPRGTTSTTRGASTRTAIGPGVRCCRR